MLVLVAWIQAIYFFITGIWPILNIRSFMMVTGPKTDVWLVKTVGVLVGVVGAVIAMAAYQHRLTPEIAMLAVGSAAALMLVDVVYVARRVIDKIYLLDAVAELVLIAGWAVAWWSRP